MKLKLEHVLYGIALVLLLMLSSNPQFAFDSTNVSTTVNVTNSKPEITSVILYDGANINLSEGTTHTVWCNVTIKDYNGNPDIDTVNATLFIQNGSIDPFSSDDNFSHYTNNSCVQMSASGYFANYTCTFPTYYYASNGTWNCTAFVNDSFNFNGNGSDSELLLPLYALNLTDLIDYGNLPVENTSENISVNITNFGNMDINISVYGFGNETGDGLAMVCEQNNISISNERYTTNPALTWAAKTPLTGTETQANLTIARQSTPAPYSSNLTYWQLYIDPLTNPYGRCNGTVVFSATVP